MAKSLWLSPTKMGMYLRCPAQFMNRYILGKKVPPSGAMKQSSVFHSTAEKNYAQKIGSRTDLKENDLTEFYADEYEKQWLAEGEVVLHKDETKGALKDQGIQIVRTYRGGIAPKVQPVAVERNFKVVLGNQGDTEIVLNGVIDVIDEAGRIRDNKAMAPGRVPDFEDLATDPQLTTYALARKKEDGKGTLPSKDQPAIMTLDVVVKKVHPEARILPTGRSYQALQDHINTVANVAKGIMADAFPRHTRGWWCSKDWCGYWDECMGRGIVATVDLGENLEPQLKESIEREEKGQEEVGQKTRKEPAQAGQEGGKALQAAAGKRKSRA